MNRVNFRFMPNSSIGISSDVDSFEHFLQSRLKYDSHLEKYNLNIINDLHVVMY